MTKSSEIVFKTARQLLKEQEKSAGFSNKPAADFGARTTTRILLGEAISYKMYRPSDTYKGSDENLKEIQDKINCLQRSQVYVHNHMTRVEKSIDELKSLLFRRLTEVESYDVRIAEVN